MTPLAKRKVRQAEVKLEQIFNNKEKKEKKERKKKNRVGIMRCKTRARHFIFREDALRARRGR